MQLKVNTKTRAITVIPETDKERQQMYRLCLRLMSRSRQRRIGTDIFTNLGQLMTGITNGSG